MAAVFDSAEMSHRVAASGSRLRAAARDEWERNAQLMEVLEGVEQTLVHNRQHIRRLEEKQGRGLEEFQRLRNLLHDLQSGAPLLFWRCFYPKTFAARADLIDRLDAIISAMNQDGEEGSDANGAKEPGTALLGKRPSRVLAFFGLIGSLIAAALFAIFNLLGSPIAATLVTRNVNSSLPFHLVRRNKTPPRKGALHGRGI